MPISSIPPILCNSGLEALGSVELSDVDLSNAARCVLSRVLIIAVVESKLIKVFHHGHYLAPTGATQYEQTMSMGDFSFFCTTVTTTIQ